MSEHVLGERAMRRQLAADDDAQARNRGVVDDKVLTRDRAGAAVLDERQRPHPRARVQNARPELAGAREHALGLVDEIVDLGVLDRRLARIALVTQIGRADEHEPVPRDDEERPAVASRLGVDGRAGGAGKRLDDEMAALRAADERPRALGAGHAVDPGTRRVDDVRGGREARAPVLVAPLDADGRAVGDADSRHRTVRVQRRPVRDGVDGELDDEPFRKRALRVPVDGGAGEPGFGEARQAPAQRLAAEHAMTRQPAAESEHVVERQPEPDLPAPALRAAVQRQSDLQRPHEMRRELEQPLALVQRLVNEPELRMLEVPQPSVDQPRRRGRRPAAQVAAIEQRHRQPAQRRLARDGGTVDPGPDDDQVDLLLLRRRDAQGPLPCLVARRGGAVHVPAPPG